MPAVTVVIRAKDEAASIGETLERLRAQTVPAEEVQLIVVDSGSSDDTVAIARRHGAQVLEIPAASFTFGGSLNHGCFLAQAPITVALSAHAFPIDEHWLAHILATMSDERVACACGDDYLYDGAPLHQPVTQDFELARRHWHWGYSNAAGAFRTELWRRRAFREDMPGTEDKEWAWWWLRRGHVCVVSPQLLVDHKHSKDPILDQYVRARREAVGFAMYLDPIDYGLRDLARDWWRHTGGYDRPARARLSHRRAARLAGKYVGLSRRALRDQRARPVPELPPAPGLTPNVPEQPLRIAVMVDRFPVLSETFVVTEIEELRRLGHQLCVEGVMRPSDAMQATDVPTAYVTDETPAAKLSDLAWLIARHPLRCLADLPPRRRWRREEEVAGLRALAGRARRIHRRNIDHLHVHFATRSALEALRIARILGLPHSVTAHAYEIFSEPANLREKLARASFVTTGCEYNVRHLRELLGPAAAPRVHQIVMGVDAQRFARTSPLPAGRRVAAIGRLVEKKGFDVLVRACGEVHRRARLDGVVIAGEGPQRERLAELVSELGLDGVVSLPGAVAPDEVRALLESADVLAMPAVVAANGDRDSMPVVVKEAMAMELLVAASDEVGLPEAVRSPWGRLAPPGDASALAGALEELLALDERERREAGAAARAWVLEHACSRREAHRLAQLIRAAVNG